MASTRSNFLDKVLGRIGRLDAEGLQTVVQRLARERSFLETLFNTIEDGVLVVDEQGRVIYFNQAVAGLLSLPPGSEGQPIQRLLPDLDWSRLLSMDAAGGKQIVRHEFEVEYPRPRFLRLYAAPLDGESAGSSGVALILHDATEARQKTFQAIESERIQALTLLAASVAHEIGNPLNALHIHLQLMERELDKVQGLVTDTEAGGGGTLGLPRRSRKGGAPSALPERIEKLQKYLSVAKDEIGRLDYIVTQFLQAIRPSPPQIKLSFLNEVVRETVALLAPEVENRGLILREKLARQLPAAPMDPAQIKQVLLNLLKNAMQASTRGGSITVQTGIVSDGVWFSVSDAGTGIPPELVKRIDEPFFTTKERGSGLGLMIVQRIIRAHGGRIELESHVGQGTRFRVWLPLHERPPRLLEAHSHD